MIQYVDSLHIHDFCNLLSDAHCAVSLTLDISYNIKNIDDAPKCVEKIKFWDGEKAGLFINNLEEHQLGDILNFINDIQTKQTISQTDVDHTARSVAGRFQINSYNTFGTVNFKFNEHFNKLPNWFNGKCKAARKRFHNANCLYKLRQSFENKQSLKLRKRLFQQSKIYINYLNLSNFANSKNRILESLGNF